MIWEEVEKKYGKKLANKMSKSKYLIGITVMGIKNKKGAWVTDFPKSDIENAYDDVMKKPIHWTRLD